MNQFSTRLEKRVTVQTYKPTAQSLLTLLEEHAMSTDTQLLEWTVDIEKIRNEGGSQVFPAQPFRWEITLTRSIK